LNNRRIKLPIIYFDHTTTKSALQNYLDNKYLTRIAYTAKGRRY